ncbi:hypothetical protein [Okeania sp. SIO1I7]|uniref:hypothetical protein n=1 Tax=Okeania sp. SIO1I7 TaxID=2607772 RepID=UPI0013FC7D36|nr:hypothetical protein [Okeania sp. SIO1I7]NET28683.1 hypothetical protein [Okeania sp. SIO1I7]
MYRNSNNYCFLIHRSENLYHPSTQIPYNYYQVNQLLAQLPPPPVRGIDGSESIEVNPDFRIPVDSLIGGDGYLYINKYDRVSTNSSILWLFQGFKFKSPCYIAQIADGGRVITSSEAVKIVESLQYLSP